MRILIFVTICFIAIGCRPIKSTRNSFSQSKFCYSGIEKSLYKTSFNIHGYYHIVETKTISWNYPPQEKVVDIVIDFVFFNDGSFVYTFNPKTLSGLMWGTYIIEQDTIKGHFIEPPRGMSWEAGYVWFKIIDRSSLQQLHFKYRTPIVDEEINAKKDADMPIGKFINLDSASYQQVYQKNWLKNRKWYWCNEADFMKWKSQIKK